MNRQQDSVERLVEEYAGGAVDRREFFRRAGALGITTTAAGALLASPALAGGKRLASPRVKRGGTFIEGYDRDFTKMDTVQSGWADPGYNAIYEYVLIRDPHGKIVKGGLIDSWKVSKDARHWEFKIRNGLKFHSGAPLTAQSVVDNFNIFKDPAMIAITMPQDGEILVAIDNLGAEHVAGEKR